MASGNFKHQFTFAIEIPEAPEREGGLDVGWHFRQKHFTILGLEDFLNPRDRRINTLILLPESAQDFDEKAARTAGSVRHADFGELRHEFVCAFEITFLAADGLADFIHDASGQRVDK